MSQVLNTLLSLILIVAIPFLVSMIIVYAVYNSRFDDSTRVCPDRNEKYSFEQIIALDNHNLYRHFVRKCAQKTSFPLIGAVIRKSERNTKHEYACAAFLVTPNSAVTSSTCLNNTNKTEISNIYHVHSHCDKWNSETCLVHFINDVEFMPQDDSDFHITLLQVVPEIPMQKFGEVFNVERPCTKNENGMLNCADLTEKIMYVYFWRKSGEDFSILRNTIKVAATCDEAKKNQICFLYSDCDEISTGVVLDANNKYIGSMMEDVCRSTATSEATTISTSEATTISTTTRPFLW